MCGLGWGALFPLGSSYSSCLSLSQDFLLNFQLSAISTSCIWGIFNYHSKHEGSCSKENILWCTKFLSFFFFLPKNKTFSMNHFIEWSPRKIIVSLRTEMLVLTHSACILEPNLWVPVPEVPCISTKILASHLIFQGGSVFVFFTFETCKASNSCGGWVA